MEAVHWGGACGRVKSIQSWCCKVTVSSQARPFKQCKWFNRCKTQKRMGRRGGGEKRREVCSQLGTIQYKRFTNDSTYSQ